MQPISIAEPFTRGEILRELRAVREWSRTFWSSFPLDELFSPIGDAWSPADNVRHLIKSNRPVARALHLPKLLLVVRFGPGWRPSRSYSALQATYLGALSAGLRAGSFTPTPLPPEQQTGNDRAVMLARLDASLADLLEAMERWPEWWMDHVRLPHPGLGLLTVREMLFFTIYHNTHHAQNVAGRKNLFPEAHSGERIERSV